MCGGNLRPWSVIKPKLLLDIEDFIRAAECCNFEELYLFFRMLICTRCGLLADVCTKT